VQEAAHDGQHDDHARRDAEQEPPDGAHDRAPCVDESLGAARMLGLSR
jgi:hypothetical protein